ncbi:MAG: DNA-processing protein DprA [Corallococcus sp.]|nr:DNA-processing protein DprA [Corallococcus sp.]MCM1359478.1 DNA-processing protein DprA [Corallococcus sp.]MCM1394710.1 DNA-processing protein DprA [Corallococcus sp.]
MNYTYEEKICILFGEKSLSAVKFFALLREFGSVKEIVENFFQNPVTEKIVGENYRALCASLKRGEAEKIISDMEKHSVFATTYFSQNFPDLLKEIDDPPYILFYRGNVDLLSSHCLAVVGTRKVSSYGRRIATDFTDILCDHFTIVSGLAYGVDSIAHETTLKNNGKTIAVLGGGLINVYPAANQNLAERIVESGGLLLSEYGMNAQPLAFRFPHRNRLVSGLSVGLLVCQAPLKSGTASTVECALNQGRDVFVVPGEIYDFGYSGSNRLIKSMQGVCVTTPRDIEDYYRLGETAKSSAVKSNVQLDFDEQKIVDALSGGQLSFDKLVELTQISAADLNFLLANLEIKSIIAKLPGNSYRLYGGIK